MKKLKAVIQLLNILGLQKAAEKLEVSQIMAILMHLTEIAALLTTMMSEGKLLEAENLADDLKQSLKKRMTDENNNHKK